MGNYEQSLNLIVPCKEGSALSDVLRDFRKYTATQIVKCISENGRESRRSWLMWLFKPNGAITFWQPDNRLCAQFIVLPNLNIRTQ